MSFRAGKEPDIGRAFFRGAIFKHDVGFEGRHFKSSLIFRSCQFYRVPRFQDAKISFESVFPKQEGFLDWQEVPAEFQSSAQTRSEYYERASQAYRTLRYAMKAQDAYEEEARFLELEMRAKERALIWNSDGWLPKLFSLLYAASSRYGNSIGRPILFWIVVFSIFLFLYWLVWGCAAVFDDSMLAKLGDFSFQQTVRPFGVWSEDGKRVVAQLVFSRCGSLEDASLLGVRLMATVQSVISLTCVALFGFSLRRRFRMA